MKTQAGWHKAGAQSSQTATRGPRAGEVLVEIKAPELPNDELPLSVQPGRHLPSIMGHEAPECGESVREARVKRGDHVITPTAACRSAIMLSGIDQSDRRSAHSGPRRDAGRHRDSLDGRSAITTMGTPRSPTTPWYRIGWQSSARTRVRQA